MNWPHSPSDIGLILHCYYSPEPVKNINAPAIREAVNNFILAGLIEPDDPPDVFRATPKGKAWVHAICSTPYPRQIWIDATGNALD